MAKTKNYFKSTPNQINSKANYRFIELIRTCAGRFRVDWVDRVQIGWIRTENGSTGQTDSSQFDLTRANWPDSRPRRRPHARAADSGDDSARRRCGQLRLGEGIRSVPISSAAVDRVAPTSSRRDRDGGRARRRAADVDG